MRRKRSRKPSARAASTDPSTIASVFWPSRPLTDGAADDVDAAPASAAELVTLSDGLAGSDVVDLAEDAEELIVEKALELDVEVTVFCTS